jgi:transposase, IS5 family
MTGEEAMRVVQNIQMKMGEVDVSAVEFDLKSRDDIPKILRGLQHLYTDLALRAELFTLLQAQVAPKVDKHTGRPGMTLWSIFVCGVVRLDLNIDYDRLHELVNHHDTLRQMLGHGVFDKAHYHFQTLKDNVSLLTPELLDQINQLVVGGGHVLVKKKENEALRGRCDSFVVETNVHYPTDINLLYDAMRKVVTLTARWCERRGVNGWRQHGYNVRHLKRLLRAAQNKKRSKAQSAQQQQKNAALVVAAHQAYLEAAGGYLSKAQATVTGLMQDSGDECDVLAKLEIEGFMRHALRQIDQTRRRVIEGEAIAHEEKVLSIFEPHTEWVSKGKAGVPVELGVKVCILEDQHQFILHHQVMQKQTDHAVAISMVAGAKKRFTTLNACSFDKGFHTPDNQIKLKAQLELAVLPRKGKLSQAARAEEQAAPFAKARRAHSAVESAINALEVHGLDRCPDHGIGGFRRYVALAVVARNIHRIGALLWQKAQQREHGKNSYSNRAPPSQRAA